MRLMVFYDLPMVTKADHKLYAQFRKFLIKDGYDMLQYSIYSRVCNGQDTLDKHVARLLVSLPPKGNVRCMQVTEKQFCGIKMLVGEKKRVEKAERAYQLSFF